MRNRGVSQQEQPAWNLHFKRSRLKGCENGEVVLQDVQKMLSLENIPWVFPFQEELVISNSILCQQAKI